MIDVNNGTQQFDLAGDDFDTDPDADPVTFTGTVDEDGNINIPASGVVFPTVQLEEGGFNLTIDIFTGSDASGLLNVWSGDMSIDLDLRIRIDTGFAATCTLAMPMSLDTNTDGGVAYARNGENAGSVTLADDSFAIPQTQRSGLLAGIVCPQVESAFGTPSPAGNNTTTLELVGDRVLEFKAVGLGEGNITKSVCEDELGGVWTNDKGVKSCTTEEQRAEATLSPQLNTGGSGSNRWRAQVEQTTSSLIETTDSQQGVIGGPGTGDTFGSGDAVVDSDVEYEIVLCQQGPSFGSTFQNRALDSPRCVELADAWIAAQQ